MNRFFQLTLLIKNRICKGKKFTQEEKEREKKERHLFI